MNGWLTQHQEFTMAKGDPQIIKALISEFKLEGIVSFDESNSLITTTIKHDQYIRLSDLLTLNLAKVVVFTVEQLTDVMRQLLELLQEMKKGCIQHGNLTTENILLDMTLSDVKLGDKANLIIFKLKLINCAQFYNLQIEDDYERVFAIYTLINKLFPQYNIQVDDFQNKVIKHNHSQTQTLYNNIINFGLRIYQKSTYCWDLNFIHRIIQDYSKQIQPLNNFVQIHDLIQQLYQYHLITHHYKNIYSSYDDDQPPFNDLSKSRNFIDTCSFLDQIFDLKQITYIDELQEQEELEAELSLNQKIYTYRKQIQLELIIFLKQCGYFQNIQQFMQICHNIDQINDFIKSKFANAVSKDLEYNFNVLKIPRKSLRFLDKLSKILTILGLKNIFEFQIDNQSPQFNENVAYLKSIRYVLIQNLNQIQQIGYSCSSPLIDHCINSLGKELKHQYLPNREYFIQFMAHSWLMWIDKQILYKKINTLEQFESINKQTFIEFVGKQGYSILMEEMKKQLSTIVEEIFQNRVH